MLDGTDGQWQRSKAIYVHELSNDGVKKTKKTKKFFYFMNFFYSLLFLLELLQGLLTTWLQAQNTLECIAQMLTSKPMYKESKCMWGCITWCKFCIAIKPCVCVFPRFKVGNKTSFGTACSFFPPMLRNLDLRNL
jgi:hypothetical protein